MKYKIGIFASASSESKELDELARGIGLILSEYTDIILVTGAGTGLPSIVTSEAFKNNKTEVWGFSACHNLEEQRMETPNDNLDMYSKLFFIPDEFIHSNEKAVCYKYRNVLSTAVCDAGIFISGKWGTLNEFTNLFDMGKVAGVLTNTSGTADSLPMIYKSLNYNRNNGKVFFNDNPEKLIDSIILELDIRNK